MSLYNLYNSGSPLPILNLSNGIKLGSTGTDEDTTTPTLQYYQRNLKNDVTWDDDEGTQAGTCDILFIRLGNMVTLQFYVWELNPEAASYFLETSVNSIPDGFAPTNYICAQNTICAIDGSTPFGISFQIWPYGVIRMTKLDGSDFPDNTEIFPGGQNSNQFVSITYYLDDE